MSDLIRRQDAIDALKKIMFTHLFECGEYIGEDTREFSIMNAEKALDVIENLPSVEPERKKGQWIEYPDCLRYEDAYNDDHIVCSECGHVFSICNNCTEEFDFCPHCGADVRGEFGSGRCALVSAELQRLVVEPHQCIQRHRLHQTTIFKGFESMKKPKWTIENVITSLENDSCSECSYICRTPFECNCEDCSYKESVATAVEYLKILQTLNDQIVQMQTGHKFVIGRNWKRGTDGNAG